MHQLSMYLVATFLDKGGFQWFQKRTFWRKKGLFFSFEWKRQGCQSAYTFLHSQPDQLTKKATESGEIQNGNKMYHDICLITACSANSSSDWEKKSQKKRWTDKTIANNKKSDILQNWVFPRTCKRASCTRMLTRTWKLFLRLRSALKSAWLDQPV